MSAFLSSLSASDIRVSALLLNCSAVSVHFLFTVSPNRFFSPVFDYNGDFVLFSVLSVGFGSIRIQ